MLSRSNSFVLENQLSSFNDSLFSTSPCVFHDIERFIDHDDNNNTDDDETEKDKIIKLLYEIVIKDIKINSLQKHIIHLEQQIKNSSIGYSVYISMINSSNKYINFKN